jgi:2-dehydro-3-deoxyphosphogluconate aldolase / (4S)-4-hydroxy-2-oxoglutarate aldolase
MNYQVAYDFVVQGAIMAGMRGAFPPEVSLRTCETLMSEGINVFEFTMNSAQAVESMQAVKREYGDRACVGMGTVLDAGTAREVLDAGADFVVSPAFQRDVVKTVMAVGVLMAPGVTTPTEAVHAWQMGVRLLKLFPIGSLGIGYFNAMFGPLDDMKFMCNGGMDGDNAPEFIKAGAVACGMAGWLTGDGTMPQETIRERARLLRDRIQQVKETAQAV